jgi:hypothetical protein
MSKLNFKEEIILIDSDSDSDIISTKARDFSKLSNSKEEIVLIDIHDEENRQNAMVQHDSKFIDSNDIKNAGNNSYDIQSQTELIPEHLTPNILDCDNRNSDIKVNNKSNEISKQSNYERKWIAKFLSIQRQPEVPPPHDIAISNDTYLREFCNGFNRNDHSLVDDSIDSDGDDDVRKQMNPSKNLTKKTNDSNNNHLFKFKLHNLPYKITESEVCNIVFNKTYHRI